MRKPSKKDKISELEHRIEDLSRGIKSENEEITKVLTEHKLSLRQTSILLLFILSRLLPNEKVLDLINESEKLSTSQIVSENFRALIKNFEISGGKK